MSANEIQILVTHTKHYR